MTARHKVEAAIQLGDWLEWNPEMERVHRPVFALKCLILMPSGANILVRWLIEGLIKGYGSRRTQHLFGDPFTRLKYQAVPEPRGMGQGVIEDAIVTIALPE
jgi:hypothetical protein